MPFSLAKHFSACRFDGSSGEQTKLNNRRWRIMREIDDGGAEFAVDCVGVLASATRDVTGANSAESFYGIASAIGYSDISLILGFVSVLFRIL